MAAIAARSTAFVARATTTRKSTAAPKRVVTRAGLTQPLPGAGEDRPLWLPGSKAPAHLDGSRSASGIRERLHKPHVA
eukprot:scaffold3743_cov389-Prasinococcus_capsulatus_cf.AAC.2